MRLLAGVKNRRAYLAAGIRLPPQGRKGRWQRKRKPLKNNQGAKEQKTKRELQAMARERLGRAVPVRRDANGGWHFQIIETTARRAMAPPTLRTTRSGLSNW